MLVESATFQVLLFISGVEAAQSKIFSAQSA